MIRQLLLNAAGRSLKTAVGAGTVAVALCFVPLVQAAEENPTQACKDAFDAWPDAEQALRDATWCVEQLEQAKQDAMANRFKDEVGDFVGQQVQQNRAMGMVTIDRSYRAGNRTIRVQQITTTSEANPFAAIASMAQMAGSGRKYRIAGQTGVDMSQGNKAVLNVANQEGGSTNFESNDVPIDVLVSFAKEFFE
ncbi:MAG: hypothetical protein AAGG11_13670 [Pseudomonadota bacterium]